MPKLKKPRKSRFGEAPPREDDVKGNLKAPEIAPFGGPGKIDGRTLRTTGRTVQFSTRVTPDWQRRLYRIAKQTGLLYVEILERALAEFDRKLTAK